MGRFDKIRVHNGSIFTQPSRIRVYNGSNWGDLGENGSDNKNPLYVHNGGGMVRATLNRTVNKVPVPIYTTGSFAMLPSDQWCYNPASGAWKFECTAHKTADVDANLFWAGNASWSAYIQVLWLADGRISVTAKTPYGNGGSTTRYSSNSVVAGSTVYIAVWANKGSNTVYINLNGTTSSGSIGYTWEIANSSNQVGDDNIRFYYGLTVSGVKYSGYTASVTMDASSTAASETNKRSGGWQVDPSYDVITWT